MNSDRQADRPRLRLSAGQALVRYLAAQQSERDGVRRRVIPAMFGIFGHGNVCGVGQALEQERALMPYHQPKNEQAMVHTAIGFAKANERLSTLACSASIGPGATNMLTGAATATVNRIPVLLLPSDTFATRLQGPPMQSLDLPYDPELTVNDCFRPVSRFFDRIDRPEQLLASLPQAIRTLLDPERAGAVTISLPQDVQAEDWEFPADFFEERVWTVARRQPAPEQVEAAARILAAAERPLIIAGGGVRYSAAAAQLVELAEALDAPVAETSAGKGTMPPHELAVGAIGHSGTRAANSLAREADVVLCLGTRLIDLTTGSNSLFQDPSVRFVGVNVSEADARKLGGAPIVADAREGVVALLRAVRGEVGRKPEWRKQAVEAWARWHADLDSDLAPREGERLSQGQALRILNQQADEDDAVIVASGTPHVDVHKLWDTSAGSTVFMEVGFSCMGHEIPAAMGVRMARSDGEVYAIIGDGTYLMGASELVTAVQEGLKLTVVLFRNHGFQSIHALQRGRIGRSFGLEFRRRLPSEEALAGDPVEVDYAANAASFGCQTFLATTAEEVEEALVAARAEAGPCVLVVDVEPHRLLLDSECWWDVGVPHVSSRADTDQAVELADRGRELQRYLG
ncbi:MAG TPA: 3D-(3,5/4)-trihydroxycyclohexane-1,2-dione acylhydrolase (decyclizing) [Solirubrobacterales bacterium]|nr:3D-(3,5/4)-trihydroxycyclohexane-1,2-dione acylhydrolase (decyclizing) [Solirubrobacterales bacterium]